MTSPIYDFKTRTLDGKDLDLAQFKGKVLLIVNTASQCGFTPQYAGLEAMHRKYKYRGLVVLGFPCNQFGGQEPGSSAQIAEFCDSHYGVSFTLSEKVEVNGSNAHPLFQYLTRTKAGVLGTEAIKWNFTKFLVDRQGEVIGRYGSVTTPESMEPDIESALGPA
ncbi:glutathione peroxidase [Methyloterricola oryzae]|uniref:glutathione peroxidase n=1 Tax=Methyloterricola oryzae TaxID=1495050 RepID=UPI0005EBD536|nr:glutathione peroxidase [Methyloterricola oryzae]